MKEHKKSIDSCPHLQGNHFILGRRYEKALKFAARKSPEVGSAVLELVDHGTSTGMSQRTTPWLADAS